LESEIWYPRSWVSLEKTEIKGPFALEKRLMMVQKVLSAEHHIAAESLEAMWVWALSAFRGFLLSSSVQP